jgi:hypothetical protein
MAHAGDMQTVSTNIDEYPWHGMLTEVAGGNQNQLDGLLVSRDLSGLLVRKQIKAWQLLCVPWFVTVVRG